MFAREKVSLRRVLALCVVFVCTFDCACAVCTCERTYVCVCVSVRVRVQDSIRVQESGLLCVCHVRTCVYVRTVCVRTCVQVRVQVSACVLWSVCVYVCTMYVRTCVYVCVRIQVSIRMCVCILLYVYLRVILHVYFYHWTVAMA